MKRVISFFIILILILGIFAWTRTQNKVNNLSKVFGMSQGLHEQEVKAHLLVYYPDSKVNYLIAEDRLVTIKKSLENTIIQELIKGPSERRINQWLLKNTKIIDLSGKDNVLTINFSREFVKSFSYGEATNLFMVYSIVNSLTEIPGVKKVLFKSEGSPIGNVGGIDFSKPFVRNRRLFNRDYKLKPNEALQRVMNFEKVGKWLNSYLLMSDDENNKNRKYYDAYFQEMLEMKYNGFLNTDFSVGDYKLDPAGKKARVEVKFNSNKPGEKIKQVNVVYFNTVKIENVWMVDWLTVQ